MVRRLDEVTGRRRGALTAVAGRRKLPLAMKRLAPTLLCLLAPQTALAQIQDDWDGDFGGQAAERRSDFTFGGALGGLVGNLSGFPNDANKIDRAEFEADTGAAFGLGYKLWLGGALADWLSFGLGFGGGSLAGSGPEAKVTQFLFRVETFPLFYEGGQLRDLGVHADFGLGPASMSEDGREVAEGGATSVLTVGAFYEPWQFGNFNAGPVVEYTHTFSQTMTGHVGMIGLRLAFYGGPGAPDPARSRGAAPAPVGGPSPGAPPPMAPPAPAAPPAGGQPSPPAPEPPPAEATQPEQSAAR